MVFGTRFSKPLPLLQWFQEITGTHGSAAAQRLHRYTMSLFDPKQMPPSQRCILLQPLFHRWALPLSFPTALYFACCTTEFLWGWRQHNMLQLLITPCSTAVKLYVMKSSPALTPISGTDPLCKFLLMPWHFIPFPSLFSSCFKDHEKLLRRRQLGVL